MSIVASLLKVVLSPCKTAGGVHYEQVALTVRIVAGLHHPVAYVFRAVAAGTAVAGDGSVDGDNVDEGLFEVFQIVDALPAVVHRVGLAVVSHLILTEDVAPVGTNSHRRLLLAVDAERRVVLAVMYQRGQDAMHEGGQDHPFAVGVDF